MKYLAFIIVCMLFPLHSCNRNADEIASQKDKLVGTWEWNSSKGGLNGNTVYAPTLVSTKQIVFTKDSVKFCENHIIKSKSAYSVQVKNSIYGGQKEMIVYIPERVLQNIRFNGDLLILTDECFDCFTHEYKTSAWICGTP